MNNYKKLLEKFPFLIMSHRGHWGGNIIENTKASSILADKAGADIVEIDVGRSADGYYYLFHSNSEKRLLGVEKPLYEYKASELDQMSLINTIGSKSGFYLEKLEDYLDWLPENMLVNIDRSWFYWEDEEFFDLLRNSGKTDQLFLKSKADKKLLDLLASQAATIPYVVMAKEVAEVELILESYPMINLIGIELLPTNEEDEILDADWLEQMRQKDLLLIANTIDLGAGYNLFLSANDTIALTKGVENSWDHLAKYKLDVIQTDWPSFLYDYREEMK